jgi:hypothetical protein
MNVKKYKLKMSAYDYDRTKRLICGKCLRLNYCASCIDNLDRYIVKKESK